MNGTLIHGDCLEVMRGMPTGSCRLAMTSPPYVDCRTYGIDFKLSGQGWCDWMAPRVVEACRVVDGLVLVNMAGKVRNFSYEPVVEWLVADLTRQHGIVCGPAPYVFHRVGIPGSGGKHYHRRDWEPVYAFARPECLPLKWSANTAMGHPPKWAPGGEMSNRLTDGARVNQRGHPIDSGATVVDPDGSVRSEGTRPSHKLAVNQWGGSYPPDSASNARTANGKRDKKFRPSHKRRLERGNEKGAAAVVPVLANPGNVAQETYTVAEVAALLDSGDVVKCLVGGGVMGDRLAHVNEAPFPERLCEFFIRSYCPEGEAVLDPFLGSGTVAKVAQIWGRKFVGIDVRESQIELCQRRLLEYGHPLFAGLEDQP